jgi:PAT family acetyl-CoA transporter-like MFS transporter 1
LLLYTLQGIPIGLSLSIPLLLQSSLLAAGLDPFAAQALFSLCSWPFSLKLAWAPFVDAKSFPLLAALGPRKSWIVPLQLLAGALMFCGASTIESYALSAAPDVPRLTAAFFLLYFLMATQDIAVDGWSLTMLSKPNRQYGPVCNSIGQNVGQAIAYTGFIALNDEEVGTWLREMLHLAGSGGLVTLAGFFRGAGLGFIAVTLFVAIFKKETPQSPLPPPNLSSSSSSSSAVSTGTASAVAAAADDDDDSDAELDAASLGIYETYRRLFSTLKLPNVQLLLLIRLTYRFRTSLSDNVKTLKYLDLGLPKSALAMMSPTVVLPLGILTPLLASRYFSGRPLSQFLFAYKLRVTLVPILDTLSLLSLQKYGPTATSSWGLLVLSTIAQTVCASMNYNAQMSFFSTRVDKNIGGSYMTLLNTFANLGGTWPASVSFFLASKVDYYQLQLGMSMLGVAWIVLLGPKVESLARTKEEEWKTSDVTVGEKTK